MAKRNWLTRRKKTDPELPYQPPVWLGDWSNGEIYHQQTAVERKAHTEILKRGDELARKYGMERREFMASGLGMALTMSVLNMVQGCSSEKDGGFFPNMTGGSGGGAAGGGAGTPGAAGTSTSVGAAGGGAAGIGGSAGTPGGRAGSAAAGTGTGGMPSSASGTGGMPGMGGSGGTAGMMDPVMCEAMLDTSDMFIFDIQTHRVARTNATYRAFLGILPQGQCGKALEECFSADEYTRKFFLESDTTVTVLSGIPATDGNNPLTNEEIAETRDFVNTLAQETERVVTHAMVLPNYNHAQQLEGMAKIAAEHKPLGAWKCYTPWGPGNGVTGFWLDDPMTGIPFIQQGIKVGLKTFACHKGLPLPGFDNNFGDPKDLGVVAKMFPECKFIAYHSAYQFGGTDETQPYTEGSKLGVNSLVTAMMQNGIQKGGNIYGELGTTWRSIMTNKTAATHVLGKLLKYLGEDNVVWGTDCMWYGSPQPLIQMFLSFQMDQNIRMAQGYPDLTMDIKRKILGLNAAKAYGISPETKRCQVKLSPMAKLKQDLDGEFGRYRWAFDKPELRTRRDFLRNVAFHKAAKMPG
ncbi:MAG TPA: amidohydrolase family protein [Polyangiales bacterium]|nr:amidohydrolase family protein [Polyangiales bacterium]